MKTEIENYLKEISKNYSSRYFGSNIEPERQIAIDRSNKEFTESLRIEETRSYFKVCSSISTHSFIVKEDNPKFKKGDILRTKTWKSPERTYTRGNIFVSDSFQDVSWKGI